MRERELLTELMPRLLQAIAEQSDPDAAFERFDEFVSNLPAGVQLFSLFRANPRLLGLIADLMGTAPPGRSSQPARQPVRGNAGSGLLRASAGRRRAGELERALRRPRFPGRAGRRTALGASARV